MQSTLLDLEQPKSLTDTVASKRKGAKSFWDGLENSEKITQIPFYAVNASLPEDSFFTKKKIAQTCMKALLQTLKKEKVDVGSYTFLEPSAGEGCFIDEIPSANKKIALDINPRRKDIQEADFLKWFPKNRAEKYIVIGNPPFGVRGAMALGFIKRAFLFADYVAFILPMSFYTNGKGSNMKRVEGASLIYNEELGKDAFYNADDKKDKHVNTVFQIWQKGAGKSVFKEYNIDEFAELYTVCSAPDRYCGLGRGRKYDCFIASTFFKDKISIVKTFEEVKYGSGYGIIIKKNKAEIMEKLMQVDWVGYSSKATNSCRHIRMHHIRKCLGELGYGGRLKRYL